MAMTASPASSVAPGTPASDVPPIDAGPVGEDPSPIAVPELSGSSVARAVAAEPTVLDGDADPADCGVSAAGAPDACGVTVGWGVGWGVDFSVGWGVGWVVGWVVTTGVDFGLSGVAVGCAATTRSGATIQPTPLAMIMAAVTASASTSGLAGEDAGSARSAKAEGPSDARCDRMNRGHSSLPRR
jgi:hypothetical protein